MTEPAQNSAPAADAPITVCELTARVQKAIETDPLLKNVAVIGEISNFKRHSSGHIYFTLKDGRDAQVNCVFFKHANKSLAFPPKDGQEVVVSGELKIYPPYGSYQLYVRRMLPGGLGLFYAKYEEIKRKIVEEGLTDAERKRPLPAFPKRIGIVSSRDSAGLRDALKVLERRYPLATVYLVPVNVEGEGCAPSVARGLQLMSEHGAADVVIVCRGGGSIESLWGFNTEIVARAIAAMPVPVITAIGHETDTTIADLVADRRAATPTEAAELATPSVTELAGASTAALARARRAVLKRLADISARLGYAGRTVRSPQSAIEFRMERLDRVGERMLSLVRAAIVLRERRVEGLGAAVRHRSPRHLMRDVEVRLAERTTRIRHAMARRIARHEQSLGICHTRLVSANPTAILARGYAVPLRAGRAVRDASELTSGDELELRLHRGTAICEVTRTMPVEQKEEHNGQS